MVGNAKQVTLPSDKKSKKKRLNIACLPMLCIFRNTQYSYNTHKHCLIFTITTFASAAAFSAAVFSGAAFSAAALASAPAFAFASAAAVASATAFQMPPQVSHKVSYPTVCFQQTETGMFCQARPFPVSTGKLWYRHTSAHKV